MAGIYLHIPFCKQKCRYCDFVSFCNRMDVAEAYMACLIKEIEMRGKEFAGKTFDTVYFGGGTPSVIDPKYIYAAMRRIGECFTLSARPEVTIEMNPGTVSEQKIALYKRAGINRFSVGLQSAIDAQLADLGRVHTVRDYLYCTSLLKGENFSADVMIGIRGQTQDDLQKTIAVAAGSGAKHISMYALTPEDGTPIYTDYLNGELPDGDEVAALYEFGCARLAEAGYARYEVSNFCQKGCESRHNLNYWRRGEYVGLGVSASSFFSERRLLNTTDLDEYIKCILSGFFPVIDCEDVGERDARFEYVMLGLRTVYGISAEAYKRRFGTDWRQDFADAYRKTRQYLAETGDVTRIKDEFLFVQNQILSEYAQ